ncbi:MAG: hypothetical protein U0228_35490 [Myxococcaceae bacterium]
MPKIERAPSSVSNVSVPTSPGVAKTATVAKPSAPAPSAPPPAAQYAGTQAPARSLIPTGTPVSKSADPGALWGEQPKPLNLDREAFAKLSPTDQAAALQKCRERRDQLGGEINHRVDELDHKWKYSRLSTRTEALREYQDRSEHLSPQRRQQLDALLAKSEGAQQRINELRAKADALPKTPEGKAQMAELRKQIAHELRRARDEQSKVVKQATAVVDADGLKVDRLAVTEQVIDPNAPKPGSGKSLLEKVAEFFHVDAFFQWAVKTFSGLTEMMQENFERRAEERKEEAIHDQDDRRRRDRLERTRVDEETVGKAREALSYLLEAGMKARAATAR